MSQRDYAHGVEGIGGAFGFKRQTVSTSFKRSSLKRLEAPQNRDLGRFNVKVVFIDGKRFKSLGVVVALGMGETGRSTFWAYSKRILRTQ